MSRWGMIGLACTAACAVVAALLADTLVPSSQTVGVIPVPGQASLVRPDKTPADRRRAWRMVLRLDPDLRQPGPPWALREGLEPGAGYELAWQPESLTLFLQRGGERPLILGGVRLKAPPREVVLARRGTRLSVTVDGRTELEALDPEGVPEPAGRASPDGWSVATPSSLGGTIFAVHDDGDLPAAYASDLAAGDTPQLRAAILQGPRDTAEQARSGGTTALHQALDWQPAAMPGRPDHALLRVRLALATPAERQPELAARRLGEAARAVAALGTGHPDRARLAVWLAWCEARGTLAMAGPGDAERIRAPLEQLAVLARSTPVPEAPGMLIALLPGIAEHAVRRPPAPRPLATVLAERAAWLAILDSAARTIRELQPAWTPAAGIWQLQFISHACAALSGDSGSAAPGRPELLPTPASAPEWLAARWRTLAGGDPGDAGLAPLASAAVGPDPLLPVVDLLVRAAAIEPLTAVRLRAALAEPGMPADGLHRRWDAADPRFSALSDTIMALAALHAADDGPQREKALGHARSMAERLGSVDGGETGRPDDLVCYDPLAFALASLTAARCQPVRNAAAGPVEAAWSPPALTGRFARLAPFAQLLAGDQQSTELIWLHDDSVLPPAHALAAALAMREVRLPPARTRREDVVGWALLRRLRCYTLPLELLDPQPVERPGDQPRIEAAGP